MPTNDVTAYESFKTKQQINQTHSEFWITNVCGKSYARETNSHDIVFVT